MAQQLFEFSSKLNVVYKVSGLTWSPDVYIKAGRFLSLAEPYTPNNLKEVLYAGRAWNLHQQGAIYNTGLFSTSALRAAGSDYV